MVPQNVVYLTKWHISGENCVY